MKSKHPVPGIVTFPIAEGGLTPLSNLVNILLSLSDEVYLITGGAGYTSFRDEQRVHAWTVEHRAGAKAVLPRAMNYFGTQLKISLKLIRQARRVNLWLFFIGGEGLVLPMLTAKLLGKEIAIVSAGSGLRVAQQQEDPLAWALALLQGITYRLADKIILYSERLVAEYGLSKYRRKTFIAPRHFVDFDNFKIKKTLTKRRNLIGYLGALSQAKGILNLLEAIPKVLTERSDLGFLLAGSGELETEVEVFLAKRRLNRKVKRLGWIPHHEIPDHLNELKLLVLPSFTEGLPNIMLEAMACGTPVLVTAVGAIPDLIKDGETGFVMEDNFPKCIARNVIRALNHPNLEQITRNARVLIEKEFTCEKAVERYRKILSELPARN